MSVGRDPARASSAPKVTFEVDHFGWTAADRLELAGRWRGVRGRRFLRPTLDVELDEGRRRLLALLEHKPWTAVDGEEWVAAFKWEGDPAEMSAELSVGPDLAVELPAPTAPGGKRRKTAAQRSAAGGAATAGFERREARKPRAEALERELGAARGEAQRVSLELERARAAFEAQTDRLRAEVTAAEQARQRLETELQEARGEVSALQDAADRQREELHRGRDTAVTERDEALAEARQAKRDRDAAQRERMAMEHDRDSAIQERDKALEESGASISTARAVAVERDDAVSQRDAVVAERDAAAAEREGAASEQRRPSIAIGAAPQQGGPAVTTSPIVAGSRGPSLGPRLFAFAVLTVFAALLVYVLATSIW